MFALLAILTLAAPGVSSRVAAASPSTFRAVSLSQEGSDARAQATELLSELQEEFAWPVAHPRPNDARVAIERAARELFPLLAESEEEWAARSLWRLGELAADHKVLSVSNRALDECYAIREAALPSAHLRLAMARRALMRSRARLGDIEGALELTRLELEAFADGDAKRDMLRRVDARCDLALLLAEAGRLADARRALDDALAEYAASDAHSEARLNGILLERAMVLAWSGEWDAACDDFERALHETRTWLFARPYLPSIHRYPVWRSTYLELATRLVALAPSHRASELRRSVQDGVFSPSGRALEFDPSLDSVSEEDPDSADRWCAELVEVLRETDLEPGPRAELFASLANAYATHVNGHDPAWRDARRGGRSLRGLCFAASSGDLAAVHVLLERGVDPRGEFVSVSGRASRSTSLEAHSPLRFAAEHGSADVVRVLLDAGAAVDRRFVSGRTALSLAAAEHGRAEVLRVLLERGADPLALDDDDVTPVAWSASDGDYGGFVLLANAADAAGMTAEQRALVRARLDERDGERAHRMRRALDPNDATPLHAAARRGPNTEVARLIESGADVNALAEEDGWSPLHWAAGFEGDVERTRLLLDAGADPIASTLDGYTPLFAAIEANGAERVRLLLGAGARPNDRDVHGDTALHVAGRHADVELVRLLLESGADPTLTNASRWRPFECARIARRAEIASLLSDAYDGVSRPERLDEIELVTSEDGDDSPGSITAVEAFVGSLGSAVVPRGSLRIDAPTLPVAFKILWVIDGAEYEVGSCSAEPGEVRTVSYKGLIRVTVPDRIDVVLVPDRRVALSDLRAWRIWGERVVIDGVRVLRD